MGALQKWGGSVSKGTKDLENGDVKGAMKDTQAGTVGGQVADAAGIKDGTVLGDVAHGDLPGAISDSKSHASDRAKKLADEMAAKDEEQYGANKDYASQLHSKDLNYLGTVKGAVDKYQGDLNQLTGEAKTAQSRSDETYSNQIQPRMKDLMEQAHTNASRAMSLKDAMDPNNSVAASTRKLYQTQAQNEGRSGLASAATLQALGAQNFGGQLQGAGPMTGGQMAALMGQNQAASGAAYANTQRRMQNLQDQGLTQGFARSDVAYNQGRQAVNDYGQSVNNYQNSGYAQNAQDKNFRGERGGYAGTGYGIQQQMNDAAHGVDTSDINRNMAIYNSHMGGQQAGIVGQIQGINAGQAADAQTKTGIGSAVATGLGTYFGGPAVGAAAGQGAKSIGDANAPAPNAVPQYGTYGNGAQQGPPAYAAGGASNTMPPGEGGGNGATNMYGGEATPQQGLSLTGGAGNGNSYADQQAGARNRRSMAQAMRR